MDHYDPKVIFYFVSCIKKNGKRLVTLTFSHGMIRFGRIVTNIFLKMFLQKIPTNYHIHIFQGSPVLVRIKLLLIQSILIYLVLKSVAFVIRGLYLAGLLGVCNFSRMYLLYLFDDTSNKQYLTTRIVPINYYIHGFRGGNIAKSIKNLRKPNINLNSTVMFRSM